MSLLKKIRKYGWYSLYLIVVVAFLTEMASPMVFRQLTSIPWDKAGLQAEADSIAQLAPTSIETEKEAQQQKLPGYVAGNMVHPYVGYVRNPEVGDHINSYGYQGIEPLVKRKRGQVNIAICGGSVAVQLWGKHKDLVKALKQHEAFRDKKIQVVNLALAGYKQPQQLMNLTRFMFLGAEFDIVINLDGFNDLALPYGENRVAGVNPFYPRSWNLISRSLQSLQANSFLGNMNQLKARQVAMAEFHTGAPWRYSNFFMAMWKLRHEKKEIAFQEAYENP